MDSTQPTATEQMQYRERTGYPSHPADFLPPRERIRAGTARLCFLPI
jgi:hypothetical protein